MNTDWTAIRGDGRTAGLQACLGRGASCWARRRFLTAAGAALGLSQMYAPGARAAGSEEDFTPYTETTTFPLAEEGAAIIQKAYDLGYRIHSDHGGCCRCTVSALQEALEFVPGHRGLFRAATCLDGGAAPGAKQSCGCFTGAGIVIGYICGGENFASTALAHKLIQEVAREFQKTYGSVLCEDAVKAGDCHEVVGRTARWTAKALLTQFTEYTPPQE
ncbi:MAG: C_GCAxxG_C_C family protein [Candidatus Hydrogenedentes bacterium]|nr:C_GCAxxG_C_C family protein [Candidatus Hydrogenedentota bacterium]